MKNVISSFPRDLRPLIETGWGLIIKSHKLKSQVFFCSRDLPTKLEVVVAYEKGSPPTVVTLHKSRVKKVIYMAHDYQNRQGDGLWYWAIMHKVTLCFDHVIICSLMTN